MADQNGKHGIMLYITCISICTCIYYIYLIEKLYSNGKRKYYAYD